MKYKYVAALVVALVLMIAATATASSLVFQETQSNSFRGGHRGGHMGNHMRDGYSGVTDENNLESDYPRGYEYQMADEEIEQIIESRLARYAERLSYLKDDGITQEQIDVYLEVKEADIRNRLENYEGYYGRSPGHYHGYHGGFGEGHRGIASGYLCH